MKQAALPFGTYIQVAEKSDNMMKTHATGAIALQTFGNQKGTFHFMSLSTGRQLRRHKWIPLLMPRKFIDWVHDLAHANPFGIAFYNRNRHLLGNNDKDEYYESYNPHYDDNVDDDNY